MTSQPQATSPNPFNEQLWYTIFVEGHPALIRKQQEFLALGTPPRCKLCFAPFGGMSGFGGSPEQPGPSNRNPRYCSMCDVFIRQNPGGAKVKLTMVFADVRDSTRSAEELPLEEYVRLINGFYSTTTSAFVEHDGFMIDVIGDEVFALYPTGFSGVSETETELPARERLAARKALGAVERLIGLSRTGLPASLPFGVSLHTAEVYLGTIRGAEDGIFDVRVWGLDVNKAARLCSAARPGEALMSDAVVALLDLPTQSLEHRELQLRGISQPVGAYVLRAPSPQDASLATAG